MYTQFDAVRCPSFLYVLLPNADGALTPLLPVAETSSYAGQTLDVLSMISLWGSSWRADLNGDSVVDINDLLSLLENWGDY
ncbi:MAG TPA: hypothetical protein QF800_02595 [Phycisphaerales bacterium]|jgi:hypothetical protein|nr:hypothetical protein [Phycisphaerales bacterium]